ncbi:hypothetical protein SBF1_5760002 [Candidatus Desulfosporosinus infrequens]|uniref:Uncharacterized protein n=1 Tax=Candidatus Desulfosporosinus infrequens TaxID=2043169 RepID=A0A2U3LKJ2_9FIRM|nr:hypothetical protein SBF1_5760002 [Candidatus Desulfosporosinus infrequens]
MILTNDIQNENNQWQEFMHRFEYYLKEHHYPKQKTSMEAL